MRAALLGAAVAWIAAPGASLAASIDDLQLGLYVGGEAVDLGSASFGSEAGETGGRLWLQGGFEGDDFSIQSWTTNFELNPFVTNNFTVTNNSDAPQTFVFTVTSPIVSILPTSLIQGSVGVTVTNTDDASASASSVMPNPIYTALIDGNPVQTLFDDPSVISCAGVFCTDTENASFGIPALIPGPGALSNIGIRIELELSPGDSVGVTSVFNIVPEPMTTTLLAFGLSGLALFGRRRAR